MLKRKQRAGVYQDSIVFSAKIDFFAISRIICHQVEKNRIYEIAAIL
jgi:hypothetical protein